MAERRTLSTAINSVPNADPDAVRAFVKQEKKSPPNVIHQATSTRSQQRPSNNSSVGTGDTFPNVTENNVTAPPLGATPQRIVSPSFQPVGLIPITVRLRAEIAGALKRASLERQLAAADFFSQQEIVERALTSWLSENGHLNS